MRSGGPLGGAAPPSTRPPSSAPNEPRLDALDAPDAPDVAGVAGASLTIAKEVRTLTKRPVGQGEPYGVGDVIARKYRLVDKVGEGGMGNVWLAVHTALEARVAIKLIRREAAQVGAGERLLREARAAAKLRHPAIVRIFDFGVTHREDPYIVMELLDGVSLREFARAARRLPAEQAVQLMLPIASGLVAAHARGVIHRDLKPENIFLARDDFGRTQPKIVDFGVAKVIRRHDAPRQTGTGIVGTPEYMAPEQAMGLDDIDEQVDVWSFSVALHELVSGRYLFDGSTVEEVLRSVVDGEVPSLAEAASIDEELSAIVARGLERDRQKRYASILEMGEALANWLLARGVTEDLCGASIRSNWLGGRPVSEPPLALSAGEDLALAEERTTAAALRDLREMGARDAEEGEAFARLRKAETLDGAEAQPPSARPLLDKLRRGRFLLASGAALVLVSVGALAAGGAPEDREPGWARPGLGRAATTLAVRAEPLSAVPASARAPWPAVSADAEDGVGAEAPDAPEPPETEGPEASAGPEQRGARASAPPKVKVRDERDPDLGF